MKIKYYNHLKNATKFYLNLLFTYLKKIKYKIKFILFTLRLNSSKHDFPLIRLGSKYGGWVFVDREELYKSTIVSCGLGEDASFDIEFANQYKAHIVILYPTPRAITHFDHIMKKLGNAKTSNYSNDGLENISSYPLSKINKNQLTLVAKAIWTSESLEKFYNPPVAKHVSRSITNFQNNYETTTSHIIVNTVTLKSLLKSLQINNLPLLKLDIEGSETLVIDQMLNSHIYASQILVEYDEMQHLDSQSKERIFTTHTNLPKSGYKLIYKNKLNFLYIHQNA